MLKTRHRKFVVIYLDKNKQNIILFKKDPAERGSKILVRH